MPSIDLSQIACSLLFLLTEPNPHDSLNEGKNGCMICLLDRSWGNDVIKP